jgi:uncharacterized membrane protein
MRWTKRLAAVVGVPALLAGLLLAGSASTTPSVKAGQLEGTIKFTGSVILTGSTFAVDSTSCTIKFPGDPFLAVCFLSGAGDLSNQGKIVSANIAITSSETHPATLSLTDLNATCGIGSGLFVSQGGTPVAAVATSTKWTTGTTVSATIKLYDTGNKTVSCTPTK